MIKRLARCVREYKKHAFLTLFFIVLEVVLEVFIPSITADLINTLQNGSADMPTLLRQGGLLVLMAAASLACGGIAGYTSAKASAGFAKNVRHDIFEKVQTYSFESIDKFSSSSLVTRMTTDVTNLQMSFMMLIRIAVRAPLMFVFAIIMAFIKGGMLAMAFVVVVPLLIFGLYMISRIAMPAFRRVFRKYDRLNESIEENVRGMRVVKGFSREEYEKEKFEKASDNIRRDFTFAERIVVLNNPIMNLCLYANLVFVLYMGSKLIVTGNASFGVGQIQMMLTYGMQILMSLMMISMIYVMFTMSAESIKRIYEVLTEESTLTSPENAITALDDGSIEFKKVNFKYSATAEKHALSDVDLKIESGMTVGVLGGTGSGKTTFVQLIPRLYDVTNGELLVGGHNVREYDLDTLRSSVAMVLQKNLLFSGTIRENLKWGNENATDEEIIEACRLAQAHDFVTSFPDGYDTYIEQGGTNVSGGQKQRLCIARALLAKPKILVLDDSTSAVDTKTDMLIRRGFKEFIPETTKIIIAQRVASIEDADLILVMDNGKIVASGKHDTLLNSCDIYREVYTQQIKGGDDNA